MPINPKQQIHPGRFALALSQERKARQLPLNLAITFDPQKHPRDLNGHFRSVLHDLKDNESVQLPDGVKVTRSGPGARYAYKIEGGHNPDGSAANPVRFAGETYAAATKALARSANSEHAKSVGGPKNHAVTSHASQSPPDFDKINSATSKADAVANADAAKVPAFQKGTPKGGSTGDHKPMRGTNKDGEPGTVPAVKPAEKVSAYFDKYKVGSPAQIGVSPAVLTRLVKAGQLEQATHGGSASDTQYRRVAPAKPTGTQKLPSGQSVDWGRDPTENSPAVNAEVARQTDLPEDVRQPFVDAHNDLAEKRGIPKIDIDGKPISKGDAAKRASWTSNVLKGNPADSGASNTVDDKTAFNAVTKAVDRMVEGGDDAFTGAADEIRDIHRAIKDPAFMQENGLDWEAETILDEIATATEHSKHPDDVKLNAWANTKMDEITGVTDGTQPDKSAGNAARLRHDGLKDYKLESNEAKAVLSAVDAQITEDDPEWDDQIRELFQGVKRGKLSDPERDMLRDVIDEDIQASHENMAEGGDDESDHIAALQSALKKLDSGSGDNPIPHVAPGGGDTGRATPQGVMATLSGELDSLNEQMASEGRIEGYMNEGDAYSDAWDHALEQIEGSDANVEVIYGMGAIVDGKPIDMVPVGDGNEAKVLEGGEAKAWLEDALDEISAQLDHGPVDGGARSTFEAQQSVIQKALKKLK